MKHNQDNRGIGDNSVDAKETLVEGFERILNKVIANIIDKQLFYNLAKDDHEDVRTSTRVADRFKHLECLKSNIDIREEPIKLIQKFYYADRNNPLENTAHRQGRSVTENDLNELERSYGKEVADYYRGRVNVKKF